MSQPRTYLDHNAGAPLLAEVRTGMEQALAQPGNASSVHTEGRRARAMIETARQRIAALVGATADRVVFTSCGSEANVSALAPANAAHNAAPSALARCLVSAIEHPSVLAGGRFAKERVTLIGVDENGVIDAKALDDQLSGLVAAEPETQLMVSAMAANNETGAVQPVAQIARIAHGHGAVFHCDMVQAAGRMALDMAQLDVDLASLSAHKMGGPQGVGALVLGERTAGLEEVLISGGGQERRRRAGTENVAGIVGFGIAAECALARLGRAGEMVSLRQQLENGIKAIAPRAVIFAEAVDRLPNTTCFAVAGMSAETLIIAFDLAGIAVSAGAACSSGKVERSHVLDAMDVEQDLARAAVRVSFGIENDAADIDRFLAVWRETYGQFEARQQAA